MNPKSWCVLDLLPASLRSAGKNWDHSFLQLLFLALPRFARSTRNNTSLQLAKPQRPPWRTESADIFNAHRVNAALVLSVSMKRRDGMHNSSGLCFVCRFHASVTSYHWKR